MAEDTEDVLGEEGGIQKAGMGLDLHGVLESSPRSGPDRDLDLVGTQPLFSGYGQSFIRSAILFL